MKMTAMKRAVLLFPMLCVACATTSQTQLNQTLQHYIGQSSDQVQNQLNLNSMGYKVLGAPVHTPEKLTYTLLRNMPIPMGTPNLGTSVSMGAPIQTPSGGSLNIEMKCKIEFRVHDGLVESIHYIGKAF